MASISTTGPQVMPSRSVKRAFAASMSGTTMPTWYSVPRTVIGLTLRSSKAGVTERPLPEREHLDRSDREDQCGVAVVVAHVWRADKGAVAHTEVPLAVP